MHPGGLGPTFLEGATELLRTSRASSKNLAELRFYQVKRQTTTAEAKVLRSFAVSDFLPEIPPPPLQSTTCGGIQPILPVAAQKMLVPKNSLGGNPDLSGAMPNEKPECMACRNDYT